MCGHHENVTYKTSPPGMIIDVTPAAEFSNSSVILACTALPEMLRLAYSWDMGTPFLNLP